jgi:hypothetical protein
MFRSADEIRYVSCGACEAERTGVGDLGVEVELIW